MAIFDIFKKKKEPSSFPVEKKAADTKKEKKSPEESEILREKIRVEKVPETTKRIRKGKKIPHAYRVLRVPHVTEKATDLAKKGQYIFRIWPRANKVEVKDAVEGVYGVDVVSVNIINVPPKQRRLGRTQGWRKGYKKAIVKIEEGQKIEVLPR